MNLPHIGTSDIFYDEQILQCARFIRRSPNRNDAVFQLIQMINTLSLHHNYLYNEEEKLCRLQEVRDTLTSEYGITSELLNSECTKQSIRLSELYRQALVERIW